ncbi:MAG: SIMPL domain-containing protein [bacterium]
MEQEKISHTTQIPYLRLIAASLIALLLTLTATQWISTLYTIRPSAKDTEKLTISAEGKVNAQPDIAIFSVGVLTEGADSKKVKDENSVKVNAILAKIAAMGVDKKDLQTQQLNLQPKYDWGSGKSTLVGYTLQQNIEVTVRDISKAGDIFSEAANLGGNSMGNIRYEFSNIDDLKQQARKVALDNAKAKAEDLAKTAGISLGRLISFTENTVNSPSPLYDLGTVKSLSVTTDAPTVQAGSQDITAQLSVTFAIN